MNKMQNLGPSSKAMIRNSLSDPASFNMVQPILEECLIGLPPNEVTKLCSWLRCLKPGPAAHKLYMQMTRINQGRPYRRSVMPNVQSFRTVDFGEGLTLRLAERHPATHAFMQRVLPRVGMHEPELVAYLRRTTGPNDIVVDIGAHVGYVSCVAAAFGATVLAVEMQPTLIPMIQVNAAVNDLWTVHALCAAMSDRTGLLPSMRVDPSPGLKATVAQWERGMYPLTSVNHDIVPLLTLDSLFPAAPYPSLVKIDVEGAEARVLGGAGGIIAAGRTSFMVEVHAELLRFTSNTLADIVNCFPADRWTLSILTADGTEPLTREAFIDPEGPIARHVHNAPVLFEPART